MTEKLFYADSHLKEFTALVLSCQRVPKGYEVVLDKTAFYPEGGGQPGDRGSLGHVAVLDTVERGDEVIHLCDGSLQVGSTVEGRLDWAYRSHLMQQHSAEHILSGLFHEATGCDNVGFHMGADCVTIDFNVMLTAEQLQQAEKRANEYIRENHRVNTLLPSEQELKDIPYRSKKELTGQVRIVEFPGADLCACCGVHVKYTGEIGLVKILSCQKFHEGVRLEILAGAAAMEYLTRTFEENKKISGLLSAKQHETFAAAERMSRELGNVKYALGRLEDKLFAQKAAALAGMGDVLLFEEDLSPDALRRLTDAVYKTCGGTAAVFTKAETGLRYAIAGDDVRELVKNMNAALQGRGGGKPNFCQGSVAADEAAVRKFFQ